MAALSTKTFAKLSRRHVAPAVSVVMVSRRHQANLAAYKRGTGGRSSFSGLVCTVFGASSFIGQAVVNRLGKIGTQIIVPYRGDPYFQRELKLAGDLGQVLFVPYHLRDEESIYRAMKYSNVVINLIEQDFETRSFKFEDIQVFGAQRIARIAKELDIQKFIHLSHLLASPNPPARYIKGGSRFLKSKYGGELAVREEFPEAVIMRPGDIAEKHVWYYGSWLRRNFGAIPLWRKGTETIKRPVFRTDLAQGIVNAIRDADSDGKTYECAGPTSYYLSDLVDYYIQLMRRQDWTSRAHPTPIWRLKQYIIERGYWFLNKPYPVLSLEKFEREHISEFLSGRNPTLEDLGVTLSRVEDLMSYEFMPYHFHGYYEEKVGEIPDPPPPPSAESKQLAQRQSSVFL